MQKRKGELLVLKTQIRRNLLVGKHRRHWGIGAVAEGTEALRPVPSASVPPGCSQLGPVINWRSRKYRNNNKELMRTGLAWSPSPTQCISSVLGISRYTPATPVCTQFPTLAVLFLCSTGACPFLLECSPAPS